MKPGFYTVYMFGRNEDKLQRSSIVFQRVEQAQHWASFLNGQEEAKPKARRKRHFVVGEFEDE